MAESTSNDEIIRTVTELVAAEFGRPVEELTPDLDLSAVEGADSVKVLRSVARIERTYDIELEDDQVFGFKTINHVADAVAKLIAERG
ncbi:MULTISPECIES: acyl carrier protein [unclassified Streptomyces]|uniref:acyl carrier protein n=1 Tax=unclassified Streptomyces TaxID=2593676 RepID=UPI0022B6CE5D|nr:MULTISPECIES: acyl carrier protein [unclassified Streptomyces]MCZ7415126.1 acyl carrier protein [Streptomyces sp. WMMC897]MCZ7432069.1 acyl carrier protein [Streptomyces sp. WMMC1477]